MPFNEKLPEWNNAGVEPPQSKKDEGFSPGEKPPAQWFNWLLNRIYKAIQELREKVVVKVAGKDLSSNDYTTEEKIKLGGISKQATKVESSSINGNIKIDGVNAKVYEHPSSHPAEMIEESATKKFVSTSQISNWDSKETPTGAQAKANTAEQNAKNYADTVIGSIQVPVKSVNNKTGDVTLTAADVGAETPSGAQSKANAAASAASNAANQYTDGVVGALSTQMAESAQDFNEHISDYIRQPGYGVTAGSAAAYTLALSPALTAYVAGVCVAVKIHAANTGVATLNINGKGAKSIRDSKGNVLSTGKLLKDVIYTMRYDGTNFILQGEGGSGNATASDLLSGKTASVDAGDIVGTMPNRGAVTLTPKTIDQAITAGYHNGSGKVVGDTNLISANIIEGKSIFGVSGNSVKLDFNLLEVARNKISTVYDHVGIDTANKQVIILKFAGSTPTVITKESYNSSGTLISSTEIVSLSLLNHGRRELLQIVNNGEFSISTRTSGGQQPNKPLRYNLSGTLIAQADVVIDNYPMTNLVWCWKNGNSLLYGKQLLSGNYYGYLRLYNKAGTEIARASANYYPVDTPIFLTTENNDEYIYRPNYKLSATALIEFDTTKVSMFHSRTPYISCFLRG